MHSVITPTNEKAAGRAATAATVKQPQSYPVRPRPSTPGPKKPPAPEPRKPKGGALRDAVALLILGLQDAVLPLPEQETGWLFVEKLLPDVVNDRFVGDLA